MVRSGAPYGAGTDADHHGRVHLAVRHVAKLGGLEDDLARRLEHEVSEHEIGDRARAGRGGTEGGAGEALLGDRRIDHALRPELQPKPLGMSERAAALAGALAEVHDVRVAAHLFGDAVTDRVEPACRHGRRGLGRHQGLRRIERLGVHEGAHRRRIGFRRSPREAERGLHGVLDALLDAIELRGGRDRVLVGQPLPEEFYRIAPQPRVDLGLGAVGADHRVTLVMAHGPIGLRLDQRRSVTPPGPFDGDAHRLVNGEHVIAVDGNAGNAERRGLGCDLGVERDLRKRRRRRIEIVLADEHRRRFLHGGEIDRFVEATMIDRAVAEEGDADAVGLPDAGADADAGGVRDPRRDDTVGAEEADGAVVEVHRTAASTAASNRPTEQLRHQYIRRHSLGQGVAVAAMGRGHPVARPEMRTHAHRGRLLADIKVQKPRSFALPAGDLRRRLEAPQEHHLLEEF